MKTRAEILIDEITENQKKIAELKTEIIRREEAVRVAQANLRDENKNIEKICKNCLHCYYLKNKKILYCGLDRQVVITDYGEMVVDKKIPEKNTCYKWEG